MSISKQPSFTDEELRRKIFESEAKRVKSLKAHGGKRYFHVDGTFVSLEKNDQSIVASEVYSDHSIEIEKPLLIERVKMKSEKKSDKIISKRSRHLDKIRSLMSFNNISNRETALNKVKNVCFILTASRSGSTVFKRALTQSNNVLTLDGEEEPYYILSKSAFPFGAASDEIGIWRNKEFIQKAILNELGTIKDDFNSTELLESWKNRILLQSPSLRERFDLKQIYRFADSLENDDPSQVNKEILNSVFARNELFKKRLYDGFQVKPEFDPFELLPSTKVEEPPFVFPKPKQNISDIDNTDKYCAVFKVPQNAYRIDAIKKLFPNADYKFIHLTRNFAQTVNGLMDGWRYESGFFSNHMDWTGDELDIDGYTNEKAFGRKWWNFDLPPNFREYTDKPLPVVCLNQWTQAHKHIREEFDEDDDDYIQVKFEDFIEKTGDQLSKISYFLDINQPDLEKLPEVMTTSDPERYRWRKRQDTIRTLAERQDVKDMVRRLNYSMEEHTWI